MKGCLSRRFEVYNPAAMKYLYWVADCKTVDCKNTRPVKFGGPCVEGKTEKFQIVVPNNLIVKCPACSKAYEYGAAEIVAVVKNDPPPPDFVDLF
jgi:hypothetical protein